MSEQPTGKTSLPFFEKTWVGSTFTFLSGILFFILCMLLPLVGPSGATTPHYRANFLTFLVVLLAALALGATGLASKMMRRSDDDSPFPYVSAGLTGLYVLMLLCLVLGLFKI